MTDLQTKPERPRHISEEEWALRLQLAQCYRIFDYLGWTAIIYNHISARVDEEHLLINPFGLTYAEVTASNLVKIDLEGNIVGPSEWPVNLAGIIIHCGIHSHRPDVKTVMHTHTVAGSAVAGLKDGLDRNNFYSAMLGDEVAYHDFEGTSTEPSEMDRIAAALGDKNLLIMRNHGLLACGPTIPAALHYLYTLQCACEVQVATYSMGLPIMPITAEARQRSSVAPMKIEIGQGTRHGLGELAFAALCRSVESRDRSSF